MEAGNSDLIIKDRNRIMLNQYMKIKILNNKMLTKFLFLFQ